MKTPEKVVVKAGPESVDELKNYLLSEMRSSDADAENKKNSSTDRIHCKGKAFAYHDAYTKLKNLDGNSVVKLLLNNDMNLCIVQTGPEKEAKYSIRLEFTDGEEISTYPLHHENLLSFMRSAAGEDFFDINSNREALHDELTELQADLEDLSDEDLIANRSCMLERINTCMTAIGERDEDNLPVDKSPEKRTIVFKEDIGYGGYLGEDGRRYIFDYVCVPNKEGESEEWEILSYDESPESQNDEIFRVLGGVRNEDDSYASVEVEVIPMTCRQFYDKYRPGTYEK